jgi:cytochrome bd-type quinol oxidase subunit 2
MKEVGHVGDFELEGIYAGLWAGGLLLLCEMIVAGAVVPNGGFPTPLVLAASLIMGSHAFDAPLILAMLTGLVVHVGMSAGVGFLFGLVATEERIKTRHRRKAQLLIGTLFGTAIWLVNFVVVARLFYASIAHWTSLWVQLALHVVAFGAPLGLIFAYLEDRRSGRSWSPDAGKHAPT